MLQPSRFATLNPSPPAPHRSLLPVAAFLVSLVLLVGGIAAHCWPWIADDAFISLRYAQRFVEGRGLTWNDGEHVEGYSNLLWVLLTAGLGAIGVDWVVAVRLLGLTCTAATFAVLVFCGGWRGPALFAVPVFATLGATAVWAIGGLEGPLVVLLVTTAAIGLDRAHGTGSRAWLRTAGLALALLVWTRPDGPLWAVLAAATAVVSSRSAAPGLGIRGVLAWLLLPAIGAGLLHLGFRLAYYGEWLPNTAYAKLTTSEQAPSLGLAYLWSALAATRGLGVLAALGAAFLIRARHRRPLALFAAGGLLAWSVYVVQIGGDGFPRSRLFLPALAPMVLLAAQGLQGLCGLGGKGCVAAGCLAALGAIVGGYDALRPNVDSRQQLSEWEWSGVAVGRWLQRAFPERPLLALDAAGAVPFWSQLPCLDQLGLCDAQIARSPVPAHFAFRPAHYRGNGGYVLDRKPDLVQFAQPVGSPQPLFLSGVQMEEDPRFLAGYRCGLFQTGEQAMPGGRREDFKVTLWMRVDGKVGPQWDADRRLLTIPGYWLGSYRQPVPFRFETKRPTPNDPGFAQWFAEASAALRWWQDAGLVGVFDEGRGRLVGEVRRPGRQSLRELRLPAGRYTVAVEPPVVGVRLLGSDLRELPGDGDGVRLAADGLVDVVCEVPEGARLPFVVDRVVLTRTD